MGSAQVIKSLDSSSVRVDPKYFAISGIIGMRANLILVLPSVLQVRSTWNLLLRSRLIESILLHIPLSAFYFDEDISGTFRVVDGVQRLLAIRDYIDGVYALECLEYLSEELNGKYFRDLKPFWQRRIKETSISVYAIDCAVPREVKLNIFRRVRFPEHLPPLDVGQRLKYLGLIE